MYPAPQIVRPEKDYYGLTGRFVAVSAADCTTPSLTHALTIEREIATMALRQDA